MTKQEVVAQITEELDRRGIAYSAAPESGEVKLGGGDGYSRVQVAIAFMDKPHVRCHADWMVCYGTKTRTFPMGKNGFNIGKIVDVAEKQFAESVTERDVKRASEERRAAMTEELVAALDATVVGGVNVSIEPLHFQVRLEVERGDLQRVLTILRDAGLSGQGKGGQ